MEKRRHQAIESRFAPFRCHPGWRDGSRALMHGLPKDRPPGARVACRRNRHSLGGSPAITAHNLAALGNSSGSSPLSPVMTSGACASRSCSRSVSTFPDVCLFLKCSQALRCTSSTGNSATCSPTLAPLRTLLSEILISTTLPTLVTSICRPIICSVGLRLKYLELFARLKRANFSHIARSQRRSGATVGPEHS